MATRQRSITDEEVALIRAMVRRKIPKTRIQAYFTYPDRPVNFGRITNIGSGSYAKGVPAARDEDVDAFLATWTKQRGTTIKSVVDTALEIARLPPTDPRRIRSFFSRHAESWAIDNHETDSIECKKSLSLRPKIIRAIAALANNQGGYIFFGVDDDCRVVGLAEEQISKTDANRLSMALRALDATPKVDIVFVKLGVAKIAAFYVHKELNGPIIATKTDDGLVEGAIYFRYPGESCGIRAAEFRRLLLERDHRTRQVSRNTIERIFELGPQAAIVDLASDNAMATRIVRQAIDEADVLRNFVRQETVELPVAYLLRSCNTAKRWPPIFYYMRMAGLDAVGAIKLVEQKETAARKRELVARLQGKMSAFSKAGGKIVRLRDRIMSNDIGVPKTAKEAADIAFAMTGLKDNNTDLTSILLLLRRSFEVVAGDKEAKAALWSYLYKAAARIDELYFRGA